MNSKIPLLNKDYQENGIIQSKDFIEFRCKPENIHEKIPHNCILGFFPNLYYSLKKKYDSTMHKQIHASHPYHLFKFKKMEYSFIFPGRGAPIAGAVLDETIALGAKKIIFIGLAGFLGDEIAKGSICIPDTAIRDEGTSYHYLKSDETVGADPELLDDILYILHKKKIPFYKGATWTTDGFYRETPGQILKYRNKNAITVDMEAAALFAIAKYYHIQVAGIFLTSDSLTEKKWNPNLIKKPGKSFTPDSILEIAMEILSYSNKKQKK